MMAAGLPLQGAPPGTPWAANRESASSQPMYCEPHTAGCPVPLKGSADRTAKQPPPEVAPGSSTYAAARRFGALSNSAKRAWLVQHLSALRVGQITLAQLP